MSKTIFQKIILGEIPAKIAHEDNHCIAIHDINPQAPVHVLIIPKKTIARLEDTTAEDQLLLGYLLITAKDIAKKLGCDEGYRLVINNGPLAGETVPHLHVHLLGKRQMTWPPG